MASVGGISLTMTTQRGKFCAHLLLRFAGWIDSISKGNRKVDPIVTSSTKLQFLV